MITGAWAAWWQEKHYWDIWPTPGYFALFWAFCVVSVAFVLLARDSTEELPEQSPKREWRFGLERRQRLKSRSNTLLPDDRRRP
jgi:hypothetical protein